MHVPFSASSCSTSSAKWARFVGSCKYYVGLEALAWTLCTCCLSRPVIPGQRENGRLIWLLFPPAVGLMFVWFCLLIADVFMTKRKRHYMLGKFHLARFSVFCRPSPQTDTSSPLPSSRRVKRCGRPPPRVLRRVILNITTAWMPLKVAPPPYLFSLLPRRSGSFGLLPQHCCTYPRRRALLFVLSSRLPCLLRKLT